MLTLVAIGVILVAAVLLIRSKKKNIVPVSPSPALTIDMPLTTAAAPPKEVMPETIVIGESEDKPLVKIEISKDMQLFNRGEPMPLENSAVSRVSSLLQAAPGLLIAGEAQGKQLMEVVINGNMVRAADGNGLRAFAMGAKGIEEHGRLFDVAKLQNMINAAAVWQIASVLVAQKHLADISKKLESIKTAVEGISKFLDNQRKSRIQSGFTYLGQVHSAISKGELPTSVRNELESLERDLLEIQNHLEREYLQQMVRPVKSDTFGTKDLTKNIKAKLNDMDELAHDIAACLKTRVAAWHVFSLYPGEPHLKAARKETIASSIESLRGISSQLYDAVERDLAGIKSLFNTQATLDERKSEVRVRGSESDNLLVGHASDAASMLRQTEQLLLEHDRPTRLMMLVDSGRVIEARQV